MSRPRPQGTSIIASRGLRAVVNEVHRQIQRVYLDCPQPMVLGYSGGKDSTSVVQLVWGALLELPANQRTKPVYVIASDTGVETPVIARLLDDTLASMQSAAEGAGLPIRTQKVMPALEDSFWVNLIGRGYPAPTVKFRWCTDRLKIKPANRFVEARVSEFGEVIMVLGVRTNESATRGQLMNTHAVPGHLLRRHSTLPGAYVFAPIAEFSADDVWVYLLSTPSPWGADNNRLAALYRDASGGECPLVIDTSTPSCGNTRFGCWVCTVAMSDASMESLVDGGEDWLAPLLGYRDLLGGTTDPALKPRYRDLRGRDGRLFFKKDGTPVPRSYKFAFCGELLEKLLVIQRQLHATGREDITLISIDELHEIRRVWRTERQDWADTLPIIHRRVMGEGQDWPMDDAPGFDESMKQLLREACDNQGASFELVVRLIDVERRYAHMARRGGLFRELRGLVRQEWAEAEDSRAASDGGQLSLHECES